MKLHVLNSGSHANGYVLTNGREALIIETGVPVQKTLEIIDFKPGIIKGIITSHAHLDHCRYIEAYAKRGMEIYTSRDVWSKIVKDKNHESYFNEIRVGRVQQFGNFQISPFPLEHDVENYGFWIKHPDFGKLVFITDTYLCDFEFKGIDHWLIEANYADAVLSKKIDEGHVAAPYLNRLMTSHFELDNTIDFLMAQPKSNVENVILLHLSDGHSDINYFQDRFKKRMGFIPEIALQGKVFDLSF